MQCQCEVIQCVRDEDVVTFKAGTFCFRDNVGSPVWLHGHPGMWGEQGAPGEVSAGHQGHPGAQCHQHRDGALLVSDHCRV